MGGLTVGSEECQVWSFKCQAGRAGRGALVLWASHSACCACRGVLSRRGEGAGCCRGMDLPIQCSWRPMDEADEAPAGAISPACGRGLETVDRYAMPDL